MKTFWVRECFVLCLSIICDGCIGCMCNTMIGTSIRVLNPTGDGENFTEFVLPQIFQLLFQLFCSKYAISAA